MLHAKLRSGKRDAHREVLRAHAVRRAEDVPQHGLGDLLPALDPVAQAPRVQVLQGVVASCVQASMSAGDGARKRCGAQGFVHLAGISTLL